MIKKSPSQTPLIGIIGGKGKMGSWFKNFFKDNGLKVIISDRKTKISNIELAKKADIVIVSVPISETVNVIKEIRDYVKKESLLTDLTSVKTIPLKEMKKAKSGILGMHPLFGPLAKSLKGQTIVFFPLKRNKWVNFLKSLFERNGATILEISPKTHDIQMAYIQSLIHFINISLGYFFLKEKFKPSSYFLTPVFKLQSLVMGRVLGQNPSLYADIQMENPFFKGILKTYLNFLKELQTIVEKKQKQKFKKYFNMAKNYLSDFIKIAEEKSNAVLTIIEKQPIKIGEPKKIPVKNVKIGFLGPKGTYSFLAVKKVFSLSENKMFPCSTIREVFEKVNNNEIDLGVVPVENSITGLVSETITSIIDYPIFTLGSFKIPIHHCLLSKAKTLKEIKIIKSHPQALSQTKEWLDKNLPWARKEITSSTASFMLEKTLPKNVGFIAPCLPLKKLGLKILAKNIETTKDNHTKFVVVGSKLDENFLKKTNLQKHNTLLLISVYDRIGILRDILNIFAKRKINLSALHSIPSNYRPWDYFFFLEVEQPYTSPHLKKALKELPLYCPYIRIVGAG